MFELCLLLKYVELNGNKSDPVPWSVRQTVLYQRTDNAAQHGTALLVRASDDVKRRLEEELQDKSEPRGCWTHWTTLPELVITTLPGNWAAYIKFLNREVCKIVLIPTNARFASKELNVKLGQIVAVHRPLRRKTGGNHL